MASVRTGLNTTRIFLFIPPDDVFIWL
jgi:hypothetical protein